MNLYTIEGRQGWFTQRELEAKERAHVQEQGFDPTTWTTAEYWQPGPFCACGVILIPAVNMKRVSAKKEAELLEDSEMLSMMAMPMLYLDPEGVRQP